MKIFIPFLLFALALFPKISIGCSCIGINSFCEAVTDSDGNIYPDLILRGKITAESNIDKTFKIDRVLYGQVNESEIKITLTLCTFYIDEMELNTEFIFALRTYEDFYHPIACAASFLKIENKKVKGRIAPGVESIDLKDLATLEGCETAFNFLSLDHSIVIFPNPTIDVIKIKNISSIKSLENFQLNIFDPLGRELKYPIKTEAILPEETWDINLQGFSAGVYIVQLSTDSLVGIYRIVKK